MVYSFPSINVQESNLTSILDITKEICTFLSLNNKWLFHKTYKRTRQEMIFLKEDEMRAIKLRLKKVKCLYRKKVIPKNLQNPNKRQFCHYLGNVLTKMYGLYHVFLHKVSVLWCCISNVNSMNQ